MKRKLLLIVSLFFIVLGYSQNVSVSKVNGTYTSNGSVTVKVDNVEVGSNVTITLTKESGGSPTVKNVVENTIC